MKSSTTLLLIAADVIVVCMLIAAAFSQYRNVSQVALSEQEALTSLNDEFRQSDLNVLENVNLSGATVVSSIRKFLPNLDVTVNRVNTLQNETYDRGSHFINVDETSASYIAPNSVFVCEVVRNQNGIATDLVFTELGSNIASVDDEDMDLETAKSMIVSAIGNVAVNNATSWSDISSFINSELFSGQKTALTSALGTYHSADNTTWHGLGSEATTCITDLRNQLNEANARADSVQHVRFNVESNLVFDDEGLPDKRLPAQDAVDALTPIGFLPISAVVTDNDGGYKYFYTRNPDQSTGFWTKIDASGNGQIADSDDLVITKLTRSDGSENYYLLNYLSNKVTLDAFIY